MRVLFVDAEKVLAAEFFVADVADDAADLRAVFELDAVHALHVGAHKVLVAQLLVADFAVAAGGLVLLAGQLVVVFGLEGDLLHVAAVVGVLVLSVGVRVRAKAQEHRLQFL